MGKKRVLIVDDEQDFTKVVKMNLEATGKYEVMAQNKGSLCLAAAKEFKPNLILLDLLMPDLEGGEVAYQLENDEETKNIPVVFLTAVAKKDEVKGDSGLIGGHVFLAKPVTLQELIDCIDGNTIGQF